MESSRTPDLPLAPNPKPNAPLTAAPPPQPMSRAPPHHRRAHSELPFRIPDDLGLAAAPAGNSDEIGSDDDDLLSTYMDMEKMGTGLEESGSGSEGRTRGKHRYSSSVDGSVMMRGEGVFGEVMEAKKAMAADKLAELAAVDPKRAKRILANRQSAARSKERKVRYISELERKVQTLQTEATTLSAQLTLFQRDTTELTTENTELRIRLQSMEQQAQLRDALNEALKEEVHRLRIATGEAVSSNDPYNLGLHAPFNPSMLTSQQMGADQGIQLHPQYHHPETTASCHQFLAEPKTLQDMMQHDSFGRLKGLDINKGSHNMKSECSSISASESSIF